MKNLSRTLLANAIFSTLTGILSIIFNQSLMELFRLEISYIFPSLGIGLLGFGGLLFWIVRNQKAELVKSIIIADLLWVVGSLGLILIAGLNTQANLLIGDIAIVVAAFAFFQYRFLNRLGMSETK